MREYTPNKYQAPENEGALTVSINSSGVDDYDFKPRAALVRQIKEGLGLGEMEPLPSPWTVEIEPTLNCNANCHFCSYQEDIARFKTLARQHRGVEFGLTKQHVMDLLSNLKEAGTTAGTYWSGGGDPLAWPHIVEAVKYASTFTEVFIQTNGIALGKFFKDPADLEAVRLLSISVFADTPSLHQEIAGVNSFDKVVKNIQRVIEIKHQQGLDLMVGAKVMVDAKNYKTLPDIVRFYRGLGVDSVGLREVQDYNYGGEGERAVSVELTPQQKEELCEIVASSSYQDPSLKGFVRVVRQKSLRPVITAHCYNATDGHFACIDAWGKVYIGNPEIGDERFEVGDLTQQTWDKIWKSEKHLGVIALMDTMQREGTCASNLCRHVRANVGAQQYKDGVIGRQDRTIVIKALGSFL